MLINVIKLSVEGSAVRTHVFSCARARNSSSKAQQRLLLKALKACAQACTGPLQDTFNRDWLRVYEAY